MLKLIALIIALLVIYQVASLWLANSVIAQCAVSSVAMFCK